MYCNQDEEMVFNSWDATLIFTKLFTPLTF